MLGSPANRMFVAERDGEIAAVGCLIGQDEIGLNYVHPQHRFRGVSRALLEAMEIAMRQGGAPEGRLEATHTAHAFYLAHGWRDVAPLDAGRHIDTWPMRKLL